MERFEDRVRASLHHHAGDVEPTVALWPEVDRRIARRRRGVAVSWSLTAAATALAAVVAVPAALDSTAQPEIGPVDEAPQAPSEQLPAEEPEESPQPTPTEVASGISSEATLPPGVLLAEEERLSFVDLPSGRRTTVPSPDGEVLDIAARPGTAPDEGLEFAYSATSEQAGYDRIGVVDIHGEDHVVTEIPSGEVRPTVVWSPDGAWVAWSRGSGETYVGLSRIAGPVGSTPAGAVAHSSSPDSPHAEGALPEGLRLTDWALDGLSGLQLFGAHAGGYAVTMTTDLDDDVGIAQGRALPMVEGLLARVDASPARDGGPGGYALTDHGGELELVWTTSDGSVGLPLPGGVGDGPHDLDAASDAVVLGDGETAWLITHDGEGGDSRVADLGEATAVSIVREAGDNDVE